MQSNFEDESCGHDVFSGGALKRMSLADIMCLAEGPERMSLADIMCLAEGPERMSLAGLMCLAEMR